MKLSQEELNRYRSVRIHSLLGLTDDGRKKNLLCPFHSEKHASFWLFPDGGYKCFGCGKMGGSAIDFLMGFPGVSFKEALEELNKHL